MSGSVLLLIQEGPARGPGTEPKGRRRLSDGPGRGGRAHGRGTAPDRLYRSRAGWPPFEELEDLCKLLTREAVGPARLRERDSSPPGLLLHPPLGHAERFGDVRRVVETRQRVCPCGHFSPLGCRCDGAIPMTATPSPGPSLAGDPQQPQHRNMPGQRRVFVAGRGFVADGRRHTSVRRRPRGWTGQPAMWSGSVAVSGVVLRMLVGVSATDSPPVTCDVADVLDVADLSGGRGQ